MRFFCILFMGIKGSFFDVYTFIITVVLNIKSKVLLSISIFSANNMHFGGHLGFRPYWIIWNPPFRVYLIPWPQKSMKSCIVSQIALNSILKSQIYIFHAILAAILDFRHIEFSDVIHCGKFGFLDPQNLEKDILQAKIHWIKLLQGSKIHFGPVMTAILEKSE